MPDAADQYRLLHERGDVARMIGNYILSVGAMALITAILSGMTEKNSSTGAIMRMVCGLCLTIVAVKPISNLDISYLGDWVDSYDTLALDAASYGVQMANDAQRQIILAETEAYIMDKASLYGLQLEVQVTLSEGDLPAPESVTVIGRAAPYEKSVMQKLISDDLGIPKERQLWTG